MFKIRSATLAALAAAVFLLGCGLSPPLQAQTKMPARPRVNLELPVMQEPMSQESGEVMRTRLPDGQHLRVEYRRSSLLDPQSIDGGTGLVTLRADNTWESQELRNDAGDVVGQLQYAADAAHTIIGGWRHYNDGSKLLEYSQGPKGEHIFEQYWTGNRLYIRQIVQTDGSYTQEVHQNDGLLWIKRGGPKLSVTAWQDESDDTGKLRVRREFIAGELAETFYRDDGTAKYRRFFPALGMSDFDNTPVSDIFAVELFLRLAHVDELAPDGNTVVRKLTLSLEPHPIVKVEPAGADGCKRTHWLHPNGDEYRSETRCPNGNGGMIGGGPWTYQVETAQAGGTWLVQELDKQGLVLSGQVRNAKGELVPAAFTGQPQKLTFDKNEVDVGLGDEDRPLRSNNWNWWWYVHHLP